MSEIDPIIRKGYETLVKNPDDIDPKTGQPKVEIATVWVPEDLGKAQEISGKLGGFGVVVGVYPRDGIL